MRNASEKLSRRCRAAIALLALAFSCAAPAHASHTYEGAARIVAVSDPHGAYDAFVRTLQQAAVLDGDGNWSGGETHLVITGDLLDRGADSRKVMDLVMQMEVQAMEQGGRVHLTLGNHEVMNLVGDLRYVAAGEYAAFADEETAAERDAWFERYLAVRQQGIEVPIDATALRAEFDAERPPGIYAHRRAFLPYGKYGRWLMQKPLLVVVNETAFVHGGLPPLVAELGLERLNAELGAQVSEYARHLELLADRGVLDPAINFYDHPAAADRLLANPAIGAEERAALETLKRLGDAAVHAIDGPLWYRGTVGCNALEESDPLQAALAAIGAKRVVIGHTPTVTRHVLERLDGRVIEIDTGMLNPYYRGTGHALVLEDGQLAVVTEDGRGAGEPLPHPRRVGDRADDLDVDAIERILADGEIIAAADSEERKIVTLRDGDNTLDALFVSNPRRKGLSPQLAAYRLDRMLALDLVPATVARQVDGTDGTLQFLPQRTANESQRAAAGQGIGAWCLLPKQWNSMYIFDVLIHHRGRSPTDMRYGTGDWGLLLTGNGETFDTNRGKPRYLDKAPLRIGPAWVTALESLTDERLAAELGDVLDRRRITALGKRRDLLLAEAAAVE